ncbi:MAG: hypothetical protein U0R64_04220 [Candidatus Nanopelagicales bacterium]
MVGRAADVEIVDRFPPPSIAAADVPVTQTADVPFPGNAGRR